MMVESKLSFAVPQLLFTEFIATNCDYKLDKQPITYFSRSDLRHFRHVSHDTNLLTWTFLLIMPKHRLKEKVVKPHD